MPKRRRRRARAHPRAVLRDEVERHEPLVQEDREHVVEEPLERVAVRATKGRQAAVADALIAERSSVSTTLDDSRAR
jgi:hypothetical protein